MKSYSSSVLMIRQMTAFKGQTNGQEINVGQ